MAAEHYYFILFCCAGYLANDVEAHLVVLVSLGFDVECDLRREAVLQQAHEAVIVFGGNGRHWRRCGSRGVLRTSPGREDCSAVSVYARRQRCGSSFVREKLVDLVSQFHRGDGSRRHRRGTGWSPRTPKAARP